MLHALSTNSFPLPVEPEPEAPGAAPTAIAVGAAIARDVGRARLILVNASWPARLFDSKDTLEGFLRRAEVAVGNVLLSPTEAPDVRPHLALVLAHPTAEDHVEVIGNRTQTYGVSSPVCTVILDCIRAQF